MARRCHDRRPHETCRVHHGTLAAGLLAWFSRGRLWAVATLLCVAVSAGSAQPQPSGAQSVVSAPFDLSGTTLDGGRLSLSQMRGKVVMVFFWNTDCAVCLQKMPELRANAAGWRGKPFELVLVNTDKRRSDVEAYARVVRQIEPAAPRFPMLWIGDPGYGDTLASRPTRLPLTIVLDTQGGVAARHEGRVAPEAWDDIAALLP